MFNTKYTVSILDVKWNPIKRNLILKVIPRKDEFLFFDNKYHQVLAVVHVFNEKQDIFLVVNELENQPTKLLD